MPSGSLLTRFHFLQLYAPSVYHDYEWFLVIPAGVAVAAILLVETVPEAWWGVFFGFLLLAIVVAVIYYHFPAASTWHLWNWILSNCVIMLFVALALHMYLWARRLVP